MNTLIAEVVGDVALVLGVSAIFGYLARRCGQPPVIGQIVAGLLFGPTLLGRLPGHLTDRLFPQTALGYVNVLAQVAVVIFMFGVGYEITWPARVTTELGVHPMFGGFLAGLVMPRVGGAPDAGVLRRAEDMGNCCCLCSS